ncbi:MAG: hypothetical protein ACP5XB_20940 [Isosphaeraceae bacterium]
MVCAEITPASLQPARPWWSSLLHGLRELAANRACLLMGLLAVNAIFLPYRSRYHDAVLYEFQVANQADPGRFAGDLFFEFGSQDSYSLFSRLMAPPARLIGRPMLFWLVYLAGNTVFYLGLIRLVQALFPNRVVAVLALLWLAIDHVPVGGLHIFSANESFTTPRLLANALVLLGLERLLAGRVVVAGGLLLGAMALHPLMGFVGLLMVGAWALLRAPRPLRSWLLGGLAAASVMLVIPAMGTRVLSQMDTFWLEQSRWVGPYLFGTEWAAVDWLRACATLGVVVLARWSLPWPPRAQLFMTALVVVTVLGIVGTLAACALPYALLVQGQPFRILWLSQVLATPLALALAWSWWRRGDSRHRAGSFCLLVVPMLGNSDPGGPMVCLPLCSAAIQLLAGERAGAHLATLLLGGLTVGFGVWSVLQTATSSWVFISSWPSLAAQLDARLLLITVPCLVEPFLRFVLALMFLMGLRQVLGHGRRFQLTGAGLALCVQGVALLITHPLVYRDRLVRHEGEIACFRSYIRDHHPDLSRPPTVYWPEGQLEHVWYDLDCRSYFAHVQTVGNVFHRETAVEVARRADLVGRFEMELTRCCPLILPPNLIRGRAALFGLGLNAAGPGADDVVRLCSDPRLDYAILRQELPGWYAARHGHWFLYDCRELRARRADFRADSITTYSVRDPREQL